MQLRKLNINDMGIIVNKRPLQIIYIAACYLLLNVYPGYANVNVVNGGGVARPLTEISGKITDAAGKPLVDVIVKNETRVAVVNSDAEGEYFIAAESGHTLSFTVNGFNTKTVVVESAPVVNITLQEAVISPTTFNVLYTQQKKAASIASVAEVYSRDLQKTVSSPFYGTFTGRLAGLLNTQATGEPGSDGISLSLRGQEPLVLLDGVPQSFSSINPEQIESVTVLRDALATAMLGIRGANGAVLITSKKGHVGAQTISFTALGGISQPTYLPKTLDAYNYSLLYNEALANDGRPAAYSQEALDAFRTGSDPIRYANVNWQDEILKKHTPYSRYNLEISGGRTSARYYVNMDYLHQPGLFKTSDDNIYNTNADYKRYILRSNVQIDLSKAITTSLNVMGRLQDSNEPGATTTSLYSDIINTPANAYPVFNADGSPGGSQDYQTNVYGRNYHSGYRPGMTRDFRIDMAINGNLDAVTKGLWIRATGAINSYLVQAINRSKSLAVFGQHLSAEGDTTYIQYNALGDQSNSASTTSQNRVFYTEVALGYAKSAGKNNMEVLVLGNNDFRHVNRDIPYNIRGLSGKLSYNFDEKYLAEVAVAYNGTKERYAPGKGFGFFPAIGLGYVVSREGFMENISWLDQLKLRVSYGRAGNFNAPYYGYNQYYTSGSGYNFGDVPGSASGIYEGTLANRDLTWEKADKLNIGIDAMLFKNKLFATVEYFNNKHVDLLQSPGNNTEITGIDFAQRNIGINRYSGFELDLNYQNSSGDFYYFMAPNVSVLKSEVVYQDEISRLYWYQLRTGRPVGQQFGYIAEGLFQSVDEIESHATPADFGIVPGDIKYRDLNNDGVIDMNDQTAIGTTKPLVYYGLNIGGNWKGIDFSALLQGVQNRDVYLNGSYMWAFRGERGQAFAHHLDRWTPGKGAAAMYPRLTAGNNLNNDVASSYWMRSGSYLRLKSVELGYKLPVSLIKKIRLSGARVFVNGTNLLTFTDLKDMDPENYNGLYPIQKMIIAGINIKF